MTAETLVRKQGDIHGLTRDFETFAELDPQIQALTILILLYVAQHKDCTQKELEEKFNISGAAVSRNINYWSDQKKFGVEGYGFIERIENPRDRRHKFLRLTPKGREFYERLRSKVNA